MRRYDHTLKYRIHRLIKWRFHRDCEEHMRMIMSTDPHILSHQNLDHILSFVRYNNRYYAKYFSDSRNLCNLPVLTKDIIRREFDNLNSTKQSTSIYENTSGGSTGRPVLLIQDNEYESWSEATQKYYFREFLGTERNEVNSVWLWGSERDLLKLDSWIRRTRRSVSLFLQNLVFLNTFDTSEKRWLEYIERIRCHRPYYIAGYAGSLYQMARVARKHNIRLYKPHFVYSAAEMLRDFMRNEIEEQFNAKVYDYYGSREVGAIAGECSMGRKHIFVMNNLVEIVDEADRPTSEGHEGRLVVTNLHNYSMPMIRYDIGDTGVIGSTRCKCGSSLPVLDKLTGRVTDHFYLKDGTQIHGEFFTHLFYFRNWIEQFQVDQLAHDHLRISVVPCARIIEHDVEDINAGIHTVMGKDCVVEWFYVESIDKTPQGKFLFTRCLIDDLT